MILYTLFDLKITIALTLFNLRRDELSFHGQTNPFYMRPCQGFRSAKFHAIDHLKPVLMELG